MALYREIELIERDRKELETDNGPQKKEPETDVVFWRDMNG